MCKDLVTIIDKLPKQKKHMSIHTKPFPVAVPESERFTQLEQIMDRGCLVASPALFLSRKKQS